MLILYDIDMTLLETNHIGIECLQHAGESLFTPEFTIEGITFGGCLDPVIIKDMLINNSVDPSAENIGKMRHGYYTQLELRSKSQSVATALAGAHDLVFATATDERKPTIGLLTGNYQETGTIKIKAAGFDPAMFTVNAWGDSSPHASPHRSHLPPVAMENYRSQIGRSIDPASVLIVGDTIHDVSCGKDNGCRVLAVATGHAGFDELVDAGADHTVENLTDTEGLLKWIMS